MEKGFPDYYSIKSQPSSSQFINIETIDRINNTIYNILIYYPTRKNNILKLQIARKLTKPASW